MRLEGAGWGQSTRSLMNAGGALSESTGAGGGAVGGVRASKRWAETRALGLQGGWSAQSRHRPGGREGG